MKYSFLGLHFFIKHPIPEKSSSHYFKHKITQWYTSPIIIISSCQSNFLPCCIHPSIITIFDETLLKNKKRIFPLFISAYFTELPWSKTEWCSGRNSLERRYQQHSTARSERWWYRNTHRCTTSFQTQSSTSGASDSATAYDRPATADGKYQNYYFTLLNASGSTRNLTAFFFITKNSLYIKFLYSVYL